MIRHPFITIILIVGSALSAFAQPALSEDEPLFSTNEQPLLTLKHDPNIFNHLSAGLTVGSTGVGLDVSTHVTDWVRLRAGIDWMPKFAVPFNFSVTSYNDGAINGGNFDRLQEIMYDFTKIKVDEKVEMDGTPNFWNLKFLVDVYPWQNDRRWRVTAGFYYGSDKVGHAVNTINEAPSLVAINMFNQMREYFMTTDFIETPIWGDMYLPPEQIDVVVGYFANKGEMGIHVGDYKERDANGNTVPYMMKPGEDGKVQAWAMVNRFRPYLGFGFGSQVAKRLNLDVDLGVMFWGGRPTIITHEGVDLTHDGENIAGRPGEYIDIIHKFTAYPVVTLRLSFDCF